MKEETKYGVRCCFGWVIFNDPPSLVYPPPPLRKGGTREEAEALRDAMVVRHANVEYVVEPYTGT